MNKTKLSNIIVAITLAGNVSHVLPTMQVSAKVIEPQICHTETWTASYYVDDKIDVQYPYLDCKADVYTDGKLVVSYWNTNEWDGFTTVRHNVNTNYTEPICGTEDSRSYAQISYMKQHYPNCICYSEDCVHQLTGNYINGSYHADMEYTNATVVIRDIDISYYPVTYKCRTSGWDGVVDRFQYNGNDRHWSTDSSIDIELIGYRGIALPNLKVNELNTFTFTPKVDVTTSYQFRILGHDITVSPEMFTGNTVATPQNNNTESQIQDLEKQLAFYKEQVDLLTAENDGLKQQSESATLLATENRTLKEQITTLKTENESLLQKIESFNTYVAALEDEIVTMKANNQAIERVYKLANDPFYHPMDLNLDGSVNSLDLLTIYKYFLDPHITVY